jgi:hypothetical protein
MSVETCIHCGKPLDVRNRSQVCYLCQDKGRTARRCSCGCGRPLSKRNTTGLARPCWLKAMDAGLIPLSA